MRWLAITLLAVTLFAAGPAQAIFSLLGIKNSMVEFLLEQISTEGVLEITAEEVEEPGDGVTVIRGLKVADSQGVWFTAERLNFSWSPSRLLRGEVEFSNLSMEDIDILRQPTIPEGEEAEALDAATPTVEDGAFEWPRSPLVLRIDRMALDRVRIAEEVIGHALAFDAEGAARDEGDIQSAKLDLRRTDQVEGTIAFDYARNFAENTLAINLNAAEAAGGLISALADLPPDAATNLSLKADGPPTDWQARFDLALADMLFADGTAAISYEGPIKVDAAFAARPGPKLSADIANLLGAEAEIVAKATEGSDGTILIEEGRISSPDLKMTASGTFNRISTAADLAVDLTAGARLAEPFDGVEFGGMSFVGRVNGAPGSFAADGDLVLDGLETEPTDVRRAELAVDLRQSDAPGDLTTTEVSLAGLVRGLRLDQIPADVIGDGDLEVIASLTGEALDLETAWLNSNVLNISVSGEADLGTQDFDIGYGVSSSEVSPVIAPYGVIAEGQIDISGTAKSTAGVMDLTANSSLTNFRHEIAAGARLDNEGSVRIDGDRISFDMTGKGETLRVDRIGPDILDKVELAADGTLVGDQLTLRSSRLTSRILNVAAKGDLDLKTTTGGIDYEVSTPRLGPVAVLYDLPADGQLQAMGRATLPGGAAAPRLAGGLGMQGLVWEGTRYGDLTLTHDVEVSETPNGTLDLGARNTPVGTARVRTAFRLEQPNLTLTGLSAQALGLSANGDVALDLDGPLARGDLAISSRDLRAAGQFAGTPLQGSVKGSLSLTTPGGRQDVALRLNGANVGTPDASAGSLSLTANIRDALGQAAVTADGSAGNIRAGDTRVDQLTFRGSVRDATGTPVISADAQGSGISAGTATLDTVTVTAGGPLSALNLTATGNGKADRKPLTATATARANLSGSTIRANVSRLEASLGEDQIRLTQPMSVTARGSAVSARGIDLSLPDGGRIAGDFSSFGGPVGGDLNVSLPSLAFLNRLAGVPITSGALDADLNFDTRRGRGESTFSGRDLVFEDVDAEGGLSIDGSMTMQGRSARLNTTVTGDFGDPLRLTATVPVSGLGLASRGPVSAKIDWTGEIGDLWALVPAPGHVLNGLTTIDLGVSGDISAPQITGGVKITDGGYQNTDFGTILTDLALDTTLSPGGDLGIALKASDGGKGRVTVDGTVALDASGIDITTDIDQAVLARRDDIKARVDGGISVKGPIEALGVDGKLTIQEAEVRLINANPPSIVTLEDVLIKGEPEPVAEDASSGVTLNIDVDAPGRMFVRGRGLDSEWGMGLEIRGDAAEPRITGKIERVRGQLSLIGKTFDLDRGRIDFDGNKTIDPRIDIALVRETGDLTGRIIVDGVASDPQLSFTSTPSLPEDEVLPRTLFGKSSQALTGSQAIQLAIGVATLMDGGGGALDSVRGAVGVDSLNVEQDEDGNASLSAGKQVTEDIWVGTKQSLGDGGTSVVVEVDVFNDIQLEAEVEDSGTSNVGVQWKKDF